MSPVLVTFARREESRTFCRRLAERRAEVRGGVSVLAGKLGTIGVLVAHTGIGPDAARVAAERLLAGGGLWMLIAAGFAGGLDPKLRRGDTIIEEVRDGASTRIVSRATPVETVAEKAALHRETHAAAVDMETATFAAACHAAGVPMLAIRAISDAADAALPVPFHVWYDAAKQRARPFALLAHLLRHPTKIAPFAHFVRGIPSVADALALAVEGAIRALEHH